MRNTPKNLNEELMKMRRLMNFDISENSHDVLSENFVKNANRIDEQKDKDRTFQKTGAGNTHVSGGISGISKKEAKKQKKEKQAAAKKKVEESTAEELKTLFIEKFADDIGNRASFKKLPTTLKEKMIGAWFNEGGLPEGFFANPDKYKFIIVYPDHQNQGVGRYVKPNTATVETKKKLNTLYQQNDNFNFESYGGKKGSPYKYIPTKAGQSSLDPKKELTAQGELPPYQLFITVPANGEEALSVKTTKGKTNVFTVETPPIPLNFAAGDSTIDDNNATTISNTLQNIFRKNEKIQDATQKGLNILVSDMKITSSASNSWNGATLPFTHNNDGSQSNVSYDTSVKNAQRNLQLSNQRGQALENTIKSNQNIIKLLNIKQTTNIESQGIVTDTSGFVDDDTNRPSNLNRGQFARFVFTIKILGDTPDTETTSLALENFIVKLAPGSGSGYGSRFDIHFSKAKYLKKGGSHKSAGAIGRNVGKSFSGFGSLLDSILP
jgi:hypothetical protein